MKKGIQKVVNRVVLIFILIVQLKRLVMLLSACTLFSRYLRKYIWVELVMHFLIMHVPRNITWRLGQRAGW